MPSSLLKSQFETLEPPVETTSENCLTLDVGRINVNEAVDFILESIAMRIILAE